MKILALSDIHDNLAAVRALRAAEHNVFDAVAVAGDLGNKTAAEILEILATFGCPVFHVYGNWDDELEYGLFADRSTQLHMNVVESGAFAFAGFSGCPAHWGRNPVALRLRGELEDAHRGAVLAYAEASERMRLTRHDRKAHDKALAARANVMRSAEYQLYRDCVRRLGENIAALNRHELIGTVKRSGVDVKRLILVTHERLYRLQEDLPGLPLHLFGHQHGFSEKTSNGIAFVNVSILDRIATMRPAARPDWSAEDCRDVQAGNYAVIEIHNTGQIAARCVHLPHQDAGWVPADGARRRTASMIDG